MQNATSSQLNGQGNSPRDSPVNTRETGLKRVLLVHGGIVPHYRIPIYGYLSEYLRRYGFDLIVTSDGIQLGVSTALGFRHIQLRLSALRIARLIRSIGADIVIDFMELKHRYLFPTYFLAKGIMRRKMIYWGQGRDLLDAEHKVKNSAYMLEQSMCSAIILYAEHLKKYIPEYFHRKTFIANNTLCLTYRGLPAGTKREDVLAGYGIATPKNIICVGRMQKRKRTDHLIEAFASMNRPDVGLIFIGPDPDGVLKDVERENIHKLGPIYGDDKFHLLTSSDVYCLPGAVGLSIVDAFHCGLPLVTEEGDESAEIMYLKDGVNGFIVPRDDIRGLKEKLSLLIDDDDLRSRLSDAAKREISSQGSMDGFCKGFLNALNHAIGRGACR
jgi:glycosyltransferase involved in cell wall biosynthesis